MGSPKRIPSILGRARTAASEANFEALALQGTALSKHVRRRDLVPSVRMEAQAWLGQIHLRMGNIDGAVKALAPYVQLIDRKLTLKCSQILASKHRCFGRGLLLLQVSAFACRWRAIGGDSNGDPLAILDTAVQDLQRHCDGVDTTSNLLIAGLIRTQLLRQLGSKRDVSQADRDLALMMDELLNQLAYENPRPLTAWIASQVLEESASVAWRNGVDETGTKLQIFRAVAILAQPDIHDDIARANCLYRAGRIQSSSSRERFRIALAVLRSAEAIYARSKHRFLHRTRIQLVQTLIKADEIDDAVPMLSEIEAAITSDTRLNKIERSYALADLELARIWIERQEAKRSNDWTKVRASAAKLIQYVGEHNSTRLGLEGQLHSGLAMLESYLKERRRPKRELPRIRTHLDQVKRSATDKGFMKIAIHAQVALARAWYEDGGGTAYANAVSELEEAKDLLRERPSAYLEHYVLVVATIVERGFTMLHVVGKLDAMEEDLRRAVVPAALLLKNMNQAEAAKKLGMSTSWMAGQIKDLGLRRWRDAQIKLASASKQPRKRRPR